MGSNDTEKCFGFSLYPPFKEGTPRFPTETFIGRYLNYLDIINPKTLLASEAELNEAKRILAEHRRDPSSNKDSKRLWLSSILLNSTFHPDTGEKIFYPFRMAGYVPFGWITVTGMLLPNPSWSQIVFWQWANQSHNACVNYANRNGSQCQPTSTYLKSYCCAVSTALAISLGLTTVVKKSNLSNSKKLIVQRFIPLPATSMASMINAFWMRYPESGVEVSDSSGTVVGSSSIAAQNGVLQTVLTRAFLPLPLLFIPAIALPYFERLKWVQKSPWRHLFINSAICTFCFAFTLPIALALFPQKSAIKVSKLEPAIQQKTDSEFVYFNRGL